MRTSFENSKAIKFKVDVEVSDAVVNEIVKRLEFSLFAGVGGFKDYPRYSDRFAGWPTIEQLRDTEVDACVDCLRKNILFRISEFAGTGKASDIKKAGNLWELYENIDNYTSTKSEKVGGRSTAIQNKNKRSKDKVKLLYCLLSFSLLLSFLIPIIHNGKFDIQIIEDVFIQLLYNLPQNLAVASSIEIAKQKMLN